MKPRQLVVLTTDNKAHQIIKAVFHPPEYQCTLCTHCEKVSHHLCFQPVNALLIDAPSLSSKQDLFRILQIKNKLPDLLLILMGYPRDLDLPRDRLADIFDFLVEPITLKQVILFSKRLRAFLDLKERNRGLEEQHFFLLENLPIPILFISSDFFVKVLNPSAQNVFGIERVSPFLSIREILNSIAPRDRDIFISSLQQTFSSGKKSELRIEIKGKDDTFLSVPLKLFPVKRAAEQKTISEVYVVFDHDCMFQYEEKDLLRREKLVALGELSAEIAHEIRNALMSIGGFVQFMSSQKPKIQTKEIILQEISRLEKLLTSIREYSRPAEAIQECNVDEIMEEVLHLSMPELKRYGISCQTSMDRTLPTIKTNKDALKQVLINLVRNACQCMSPGGVLVVSSFQNDTSIGIHITDEGPGIKEPQESLFRSISRGGKSVGLPLSHKIIRNLGGQLAFRSSSQGTTFTILLPKKKGEEDKIRQLQVRYPCSEDAFVEKRVSPRFPVSLHANCWAKGRHVKANIVNLSYSGLLLKFSEKLSSTELSSQVTFDISPPHIEGSQRIVAGVNPVHYCHTKSGYFLGCEIEIDKNMIPKWETYINHLQNQYACSSI